jgi:hypothetical protein
MENSVEKRSEIRLNYRWPVRFTTDENDYTIPGQIFDISSGGISFLCHANQNCPNPGQPVTTHFGVPNFEMTDSFDSVFFDRTGRVCRVDKLSDHIHRVAVQFSQPLFFKPGEQNVSASDAQQRLETKTYSIIKSEEKAKAYDQALTLAENKLMSCAEAKAKIEAELKAEIVEKVRIETNLRIHYEDKIRSFAETATRAKEQAKAEAKARAKAEAVVQKEIKLRLKAEKKAKFYEKEINKVKAEATEIVSKVRKELENKEQKSSKEMLLSRIEKFISDRNKIF